MGRHSRAKGVGFERRLAAKLRAEGFEVRRVNEFDGFSHGCDLEIFSTIRPFSPEHPAVIHVWPVCIQAKCTQRDSDLVTGLNEAMSGRPHAAIHVCFHSYNRKLRVLYHESPNNFLREATWATILPILRSHSPLKSATQPPPW